MKNSFRVRAILTLIAAVFTGILVAQTQGAVVGAMCGVAAACTGAHFVMTTATPYLFAALDPTKFPTLLDLSALDKGSGHDVIVEAIHSHAELDLFPASAQSEVTLEVSVLESLPGGATFRRPNEGIQPTKSTFANKRFDMALVDRRVEVDKDGVLARSKDRARFLVNQSVPQMSQALSDIAKQIIYGKLGDANKGFPGLVAQAADDAAHAVDATGTTALSSVWFLDISPASMEVTFGSDQSLTMADDWKEETIYIPPNNDRLVALTNRIFGWVGFRLFNKNRCVKIKRIGVAANKTLTFTHMNAALNICQDDLGFTPTHILGNGRSFEQLRQAKITPENPDPDRLTEFAGIPLVRSINIRKDEETL